jgi:hypothetical protein
MNNEITTKDNLSGCSIDQRIEAMALSGKTELTARYIAPPKGNMTGIYKSCDQFRCQVGRVFVNSGVVTHHLPTGIKTLPWTDYNNFELIGYGSTFKAAFEMANGKIKR